ncbi:MAG: HAMP domain-containing histidine kinase, partial [Kangiellaceae bacterium]|nr:HAMP domain-containing histidine kinase [Kangiellaceae bacterium]
MSIKRRLILAFGLFALFLSAAYSSFNFLFAYTVEDAFIERMLREEAQHIQASLDKGVANPTPTNPSLSLFFSLQELPEEVLDMLKEEPKRIEFYGEEGRHYHLHHSTGSPPFYLVAEVSQMLVVRPLAKDVLAVLVILSLLMIAFAIALAYWFAVKTLNPLSNLVTMFSQAEPDSLPQNISEQFPPNEIGVLANSLESAMQKIQRFVEREQNFTRDASHELRTPIAAIKGATELLALRLTDNDDKIVLKRIEYAVNQMQLSVDALLSLAREESSQLDKSEVSVLPIAEKTVIQNAYLIENKDIEVDVDVKPTDKLLAQRGVVDIILANLLSNAFQYTLNGRVSIAFDENMLIVRDTGGGI